MGDRANLAEAKKELEELYLGVPDESVNLTFQDFAQLRHEKKKLSPSSTISEKSKRSPPPPLAKLPSLDFSKGMEPSFQSHRRPEGVWGGDDGRDDHHYSHHHHHHHGQHNLEQRSMAYDDMSHVSVAHGRRRPGIPHSNICAICCNYIYISRHRCLVCGRVYCRQCVSDGMGEMIEGRKCIDCLGRRFSQRYIHKAGNVGCCMGYASVVKQQELKWAERGARRTGENIYGNNSVMAPASRSRSPVAAGRATPTRQHNPSNPPSFVINSPYSSTNHHPMPF